jgi:hypothetical protein
MIRFGKETEMKRPWQLVWLLFFASLWGLSEVVAGEGLYALDVPYASVLLTVWALVILSLGRGFLNKPGSSTLIGCVAALYRMVNAAPFFCHIWGIVFIGMAFDLASSLLMKEGRKFFLRSSLTGITSAYMGNALFALVMTWILRNEYWIAAGFPKALDHVFISGSFVAAAASGIVPLGYWLGRKVDGLGSLRTRWVYSTLTLLVLGLWTVVRIVR